MKVKLTIILSLLSVPASRSQSASGHQPPIGAATKSRRPYELATKHLITMDKWNCSVPRPQVVYPPMARNKLYHPRGTVLHRCNDQTGCCPHKLELCQPVDSQQIEVIFFVTDVISNRTYEAIRNGAWYYGPFGPFSRTEYRRMTNHTRCACKKKNDVGPDDGHEVQEVVSKPLVTTEPSINILLIIFISMFIVMLFIAALVFLFRRQQEAHHVLV